MTASFAVELLHGLRKDGEWHRLAVLRDPTGVDEAMLVEMEGVTPAEQGSRLLAELIVKIGDCERPSLGEILSLTIGDRERLFLAVSARLLGPVLQLVTDCPQCREKVEIAVGVADLIRPPTPVSDRIDLDARDGKWRARIRPPTGADLQYATADVPDAARILLTGCLVELVDSDGHPALASSLPAECEPDVAYALAGLDWIAECRVAIACPSCAASIDALIDGYTILRSGLGRGESLYREVLGMARTYRWSEAEILALPSVRRRRYLAAAELEGMRP